MAASVNSNWTPLGPRRRKRLSRKMRLRWANSISTFLRSRRDCANASVLASVRATSRGLINAAQDLALRGLGTAVRLQRATPAVVHARQIGKQVAVVNVAGRGQRFSGWAHVAIRRLVIDEVLA